VALASVLPCRARPPWCSGNVTTFAIGLLFFLHGAKLSREAMLSGLTNWRLHLLVLASTFVMFPLLGLALKPLAGNLLPSGLYVGILFLCTLPSTVQSSIAFTSMARGNVAAAVCSASASNFVGIFITPLLVSTLIVRGGAAPAARRWMRWSPSSSSCCCPSWPASSCVRGSAPGSTATSRC
jgi:sodium/bile acid cotransporter 7